MLHFYRFNVCFVSISSENSPEHAVVKARAELRALKKALSPIFLLLFFTKCISIINSCLGEYLNDFQKKILTYD